MTAELLKDKPDRRGNTMLMHENVWRVLKAISEGWKARGVDDRYVVVENPKHDDDPTEEDPFIVIDMHELENAAGLTLPRNCVTI